MRIAAGTTEASLLLKFGQWELFGVFWRRGNADSVDLTNISFFISSDYGTTTFEKVESSLGGDISNG